MLVLFKTLFSNLKLYPSCARTPISNEMPDFNYGIGIKSEGFAATLFSLIEPFKKL